MPLASSSVPVHLLRGAIGLLAAVAALVGVSTVGPAAILLLLVTVVAWRGCPTCWAIGLMATREREQACRAGGCAPR